MANVYADLATLKSSSVLNVSDNAHDARLLGMLEAVSRRFDGTGRASLTVSDLVSVSEVSVREASGEWVVWSSGDWLLYPLNAAPAEPGGRPYTRIMLAGKHRRFPLSRAGVAVRGVWGYGDVREDTGVRIGGDQAVAVGDSFLTVVSGDGAIKLSAGHTLRIGDEQLYVVGVADDDEGALTLTVNRGVNGTEPAAHAVEAPASVYRYPKGVTEACLLQAAVWWRERLGGPFTPPDGDGGDVGGVSPTVRTLLAPYRRRNAALGV